MPRGPTSSGLCQGGSTGPGRGLGTECCPWWRLELLAASGLRANVNPVQQNRLLPQRWPVPSHQAGLQMRSVFALEGRHNAQPVGVHRAALCSQEVFPSPSGGRPDLWLKARSPLSGGRKQRV